MCCEHADARCGEQELGERPGRLTVPLPADGIAPVDRAVSQALPTNLVVRAVYPGSEEGVPGSGPPLDGTIDSSDVVRPDDALP